jgi:hypothetical protein
VFNLIASTLKFMLSPVCSSKYTEIFRVCGFGSYIQGIRHPAVTAGNICLDMIIFKISEVYRVLVLFL